jgi:hypothetical protein
VLLDGSLLLGQRQREGQREETEIELERVGETSLSRERVPVYHTWGGIQGSRGCCRRSSFVAYWIGSSIARTDVYLSIITAPENQQGGHSRPDRHSWGAMHSTDLVPANCDAVVGGITDSCYYGFSDSRGSTFPRRRTGASNLQLLNFSSDAVKSGK